MASEQVETGFRKIETSLNLQMRQRHYRNGPFSEAKITEKCLFLKFLPFFKAFAIVSLLREP